MNRPNGPPPGSLVIHELALATRAFAWAGGALFVAALGYFLFAYVVVFGHPAPDGPWLAGAALNVAMFTVFALHHSLCARTPLKARVRRAAGPHLERSVYVWLSSLLFLGLCWLWRPVPGELYRLVGAWWWLGVAVQVTGLVITIAGSRALDVLDLAGIRHVQASPVSDPGRHRPLVTSGLYGLVRHPLYLGWVLLVFGTPHMTMTRAVFALTSTVYLMAAIPWEERSLTETFGPEYAAYQRQVRWRMLPFVY